jgi:hypothetical protein
METPLPPIFILYIPSRSSKRDPFSGYIRVRSTVDSTTHAYRIEPASSSNHFRIHGDTPLPFPASPSQQFSAKFHVGGIVVTKNVSVWSPELRIFDVCTHAEVRVLTIAKHTDILGRTVKRNIMVITSPPPQPRSSMPLFVAKQLLELAQLKNTTCPITVESFCEGSTAVMPCGHLFTRFAIEESFKTTPAVCPACRSTGTPVFV